MPDTATLYPMLRARRRRTVRVSPRARSIAILCLVAALVLGGTVKLLTRPVPADPRVLLANALATLEAGNYSAARSNALAAVAAAPQSGAAQAVLARAYLEMGDGLAAEAALARAVAAGFPASRLHQLRAAARLLQDDPDGALVEEAQVAPRYAAYGERIRARALAVQGQPVAARAALEALVASAPGDGEAWRDLGRLRFAGGDSGGASEAAMRAVRLRLRDPQALQLAAEVVRTRYGPVAALPWFEAALKRDAYAMPTLVDYAATLGEVGRNADMLAALARAAAARPGDARVLYLQAVLAARAGKLDLAGALLERNAAIAGVPGAQLLGGAVDYAAGRWEQAAATWRLLADAQPMNLTARRLLAAALLRSGDAAGALTVLRPLAVRGDADAYALTLTARAFEAMGDRAAAARFLDRAAAGRAPATAFASDEAVATLRAEADEAPGDPTYAVGVVRGLIGAGDHAGAVAAARAVAAGGPGTPAAWTALGDAQALAGQRPDAAYARAANLAFDEPAMLRLIDAQARGNRPRDAAATLALYLSQNPQSLAGQRLLGHLQVAGGQWAAAIETLEGVRRRVGNGEVAVLADLALAYAGADPEGDVALRYGRAAYALQPMNAAAADAYGVALAAAGRIGAARQLLDKAIALAPGDAAIAAHRRALD